MTDAAPHRIRSEAKAPSRRYLEDFAVGQVFEAGPIPVSADAIKAYARQFDPQPFHTDEDWRAPPSSRVLSRADGIRPRSR
jgi:acyl dehydratase